MSFQSKFKNLTAAFAATAALGVGAGKAEASGISSPFYPLNPMNPYHLLQGGSSSSDDSGPSDKTYLPEKPLTEMDWVVISGGVVPYLAVIGGLIYRENRRDSRKRTEKHPTR